MGKIVEKKRKKKKGRPSLLDLQKRTLKQQQQQLQKYHKQKFPNKKTPNSKSPNSSSAGVRRSTRRNPNPNSDPDDDVPTTAAAGSGGGKRREKKLELVLKKEEEEDDEIEDVNSDNDGGNSGSDDLGSGSNPRKRKIDSISRGSTSIQENDKGEKHSAVTKQASTQQGLKADDDGPSTRLPDKSLLLFILDRLQKKDTYGVFSEPVDPEELPDYHEVIEHPMDFGTVRKKLADGAYASLEQFEKDVFLISSNAMQYNAPDTIYFRQARSIQELAVKNFENLRGDSDDNRHQQEAKVVRRGRPPTKNLKRPPGRPPLERASSDFSEATLATAGGTTNRSNNDVRKALNSEKYGSTDSIVRSLYGSRIGDAYVGCLSERHERVDELTGSASKGILMKHGKKHIVLDENRRNTYKHSYTLACGQEPSILATFDRARKQLIAVGLQAEYGYARSLARFAAKMGPVAWKVASKKIERCLPSAVKFGPGWVGDNEAPEERRMEHSSPISVGQQTPPLSVGSQTPPVSVGQQTSFASVDPQTLSASVGQQTPPASVGQQTPPASVGQQTPLASLPALTDTPFASTQVVEDSGRDNLVQKPQGEQSSEMHELCNKLQVEELNKALSPLAVDNDATPHSSSILPNNGAEPSLTAPEVSATSPSSTKVNILINGTGPLRPDNPYPMHPTSMMQSRINGLNGSYGLNFAAQMEKMIGPGRPTVFHLQSNPSTMTVSRTETQSLRPPSDNGCGEPKSEGNCSTTKPIDCLPNTGSNQNVGCAPPDLNVGFQSPGSPVSGKADSLQPDLALQL